MPLLLLFVCFLVCFTTVLSPHPLKLSDNNSLIILRILYTMRVVVNPMKCSGTKKKHLDQLAVFRTITTRCQMDKGWINTVMQGFIEPKLHPSVDAIVVFYYLSVIWYIDIFLQ